MNNLIGKWRVNEIMMGDPDEGPKWKTVAELANDPNADEDFMMSTRTIIEISDDGTIYMMMPIPEDAKEEVDAALEAGECSLRDGLLVIETMAWKEEDGKIFFDSGAEGELFGEKISPWVELKVDGDTVEMMSFRIVRQ